MCWEKWGDTDLAGNVESLENNMIQDRCLGFHLFHLTSSLLIQCTRSINAHDQFLILWNFQSVFTINTQEHNVKSDSFPFKILQGSLCSCCAANCFPGPLVSCSWPLRWQKLRFTFPTFARSFVAWRQLADQKPRFAFLQHQDHLTLGTDLQLMSCNWPLCWQKPSVHLLHYQDHLLPGTIWQILRPICWPTESLSCTLFGLGVGFTFTALCFLYWSDWSFCRFYQWKLS